MSAPRIGFLLDATVPPRPISNYEGAARDALLAADELVDRAPQALYVAVAQTFALLAIAEQLFWANDLSEQVARRNEAT